MRYIGFSAHGESAALALLDRLEVDSVLYPINYVCYARGNFGPGLVRKAAEKGVARLALKVLARQRRKRDEKRSYSKCWYHPFDRVARAERALRFTLSEDVTAAIPPGDERLYELALDLAAGYKPLTPEERTDLLTSAEGLDPIFKA